MKRPLKIISIEGTRGSGKSSQIAMLSRHFKNIGMSVSTLKAISGDPIQSGLVAIDFIEPFFNKHPNGLIIYDGSIARPMVEDLISGMPTPKLMDKFKALTQAYERIDHKYGIANFLMVMDDMEECKKRLLKHQELTGVDSKEIADTVHESDIVSGMRFFNNHISSKNIQFDVIDIQPHQSIIQINKIILDKLGEKYEFDKPKKDDNDW